MVVINNPLCNFAHNDISVSLNLDGAQWRCVKINWITRANHYVNYPWCMFVALSLNVLKILYGHRPRKCIFTQIIYFFDFEKSFLIILCMLNKQASQRVSLPIWP